MKVLYDHSTIKDSMKIQSVVHAKQPTRMDQEMSRPRTLIKTIAEAVCYTHAFFRL